MTRKRTVVIVVVGLAFLSIESFAQNLSDIIEKVRPSVVAITSFDAAGKRIMGGTGFVVGERAVITNYHVIKGAVLVEIRTANQVTLKVVKIAPSSLDGDLAVLQLGDGAGLGDTLRFAPAIPRVGEKVFVLGNPLGLAGTVTDGIVSAIRPHRTLGTLVQITAPISPGSSGSPVINLRGEVIGLATMNVEGGQNLNFAIASDTILTFWPAASTASRPMRVPEASGRWRKLDTNMSYDTETVSKKSNIASAWIRYDRPDGSYSKVLTEVNCVTPGMRQMRSLFYDSRTEAPRETTGDGSWSPIVPESKGEAAFRVFCKGKQDYQSSLNYDRYYALYEEGTKAQREKRYEAAIDAYSKMVTDLPEYAAWGFAAIARVKLLQGNVRAAKNAILEAIKIDPLEIDNYSTLGDVYKEEKQYQLAIDSYWKVLRPGNNGKDFESLLLAVRAEKTDRFGSILGLEEIYEARKDYIALTTLYTFVNSKAGAYFGELADVYDKRKLPTLAKTTRLNGVKYFEQAVKQADSTVGDYYKLVGLLEALDDYTKLQSTIATAMRMFPSDGLLVHALAEAHNKHRNWQKTVDLVDESLPYDSFKSLLLYRLKDAFIALGRKDEATRIDKLISALRD